MKSSEGISALAKALATVQKTIKNPPKNGVNPHFNSKYVHLSDGLDAIRAALSAEGIAIIQGTELMEGFIFLNTRLIHSGGEWIESTYPVGSPNDRPQALGSAMTYARRYSIFGMVGVAGDDDDDGNAAEEAASQSPQKGRSRAAPRIATPGFTPEESEKVFNAMTAVLNMVSTREELVDWATDNRDHKAKLTPEHNKKITDHFMEVQKRIAGNG
jgi:hypothetical protein